MPFIGNQPALSYTSFAKQDFTTSATTSYTLDHPVTNENEIALFINFVRQEPTTAYSASGTSLTLTSATSPSDDMYCVYSGKAVQTVNPASGSVGSSQVAASIITGQTAETSIATDDTVLIHDTSAGALRKMTRANFVSGVGGDLTPAWFVKNSSAQSISDDTATKVTLDTEVFDTDSAFASNKFTVPSGEAGKYFIYGSIDFINTSNNDMRENYIMFYKNGSAVILHALNGYTNANMRRLVLSTSVTLDLAAGDYLEMYGTADTDGGSSSEMRSNNSATFFGGFKLLI